MRFLADMGVAAQVVAWLRSVGHDAVHLRDEGLQRLPDSLIYQKAIEEHRVILTFDLDFSEIASRSGRRFPSVITFRLVNERYMHVIERLEKVLASAGASLRDGAVVTVEESRHRTRHLPIDKPGAQR